MKKFRNVGFLSVLLVLLVIVAGCSGGKTKTSNTSGNSITGGTKEILIVNHTSLTGGLADYGLAAKLGVSIAEKELGKFKVGDIEYVVKVQHLDDKGETAEAAAVAQNAVDKGAVAIIGALTSGNTAAALPIYEKANIPVISPSATNPDLTDQGRKNFFRTCLRDDVQGKVIGEWAAELGYKKVVVMDDSGDYAKVLGNVVESTLKSKGVQVRREHAADEKETDFSAQISNIKAFGADAVIFTGYHRQGGLLRKQMIDAGLQNVAMMGADGIKSEEIFKEAGGADKVEGVMCTFGLDRGSMPGYEKFKKAYMEISGGKEPGPYAENAYDALGILIEAIKKTGDTDGQKLIDELHKIQYTGVLGTFSFDQKGDIQIEGGVSKFVAKNGKWEPVK